MSCFDCFTDEELVLKIRAGDSAAEETLLLRYMAYVRGFARSYFLVGGDFEDLIQEGMIGVVRAISEFDSTKDVAFRTFAAMCIRNRVYSAIRNSMRGKNSPLNNYVSIEAMFSDENSFQGAAPDPADDIINREAYAELLKNVSEQLSKLERKVLRLYLDGLSYAEISEKLSKTPKSVDNAVQRIRKKLLQFRI